MSISESKSWFTSKAEYASPEANTHKYQLEAYHMNKSNTFCLMILLQNYLSENHTLHSEEMISENV